MYQQESFKKILSKPFNNLADNIIGMFWGDEEQERMLSLPYYKSIRLIALIGVLFSILFLFSLLLYLFIPFDFISNKLPYNPKPNKEITITELNYSKLEDTESDYFNITKLDSGEIVKGFNGEYYIIDLKIRNDAKDLKYIDTEQTDTLNPNDEILYFDIGKYYIDDNEKYYTFVRAFDHFVETIIDPILRDSGVYYLFVRGKADKLPFIYDKVPLNTNYYFREIEYIPRRLDNEIVYDPEQIKTNNIGNFIRNEDLPNLRSKYMQEFIIKDQFNKVKRPLILEGFVTGNIGSTDRNIELILFHQTKK